MVRSLIMTLTLCLTGAICAPTQAAQVVFSGTATQSLLFGGGAFAFASGTPVFLNVGFVPGVGASAAITDAYLQIGAQVFSGVNITGGTVSVGNNGTFDTVTVNLPNAGGTSGANSWLGTTLTLTSVTNGLNAGGTNNWQAIYNASNSLPGSVSGSFGVSTGGNTQVYNFSGAAVPEPGSIALLSGLGLVFGAVARRRRQTRETAV